MNLINDNFMLKNPTAKRLYHYYAEKMPIIDYHCHLSPEEIATDHVFKNATELFLGGDHYKWRLMRAAGVEEKYITGDADDYEKFAAFASVVPYMIGNPMYHWIHLELKRYFGIDEVLSAKSCEKIWNKINEQLKKPEFSAKNLILRSNVVALCTTDDPADDLKYHRALESWSVKVLPTFRPDKLLSIEKDEFCDYIAAAGIKSYDDVARWIEKRADYFASLGCKLSDHSLSFVPYAEGDAKAAFEKRLSGGILSDEEEQTYKTSVMLTLAKNYARKGWTMQLHIGALRNNNTRAFGKLGADSGYDSISDAPVAQKLSRLLDAMEKENALPKTILYSLDKNANYTLATMAGNFQSAPFESKIQLGSGWWFNDQRDGMEEQLRALANLGLLSKFVGMLTDSRSFVSYTRHEYFRRIFCNLVGKWVEEGEYSADEQMLKEIVEGVCYKNAEKYFGF
ncbi:MAG: glucuronate isomerase [Firmicutes bacterium]|nr:glucuronate isomerase [Bacillota bacterium]MDY5531582.1 glucuronate isomerase [Pumilibacteraceae bacterium]